VEDVQPKHAARLAQQENLSDRLEAPRRTLREPRGRIEPLDLLGCAFASLGETQ